jgi:signal transduction histidine kinase
VRQLRIKSVTVQLAILFVAAFAILEVVNLVYRYINRTEALASLEAMRIADDIAIVSSLIDKASPEERPAEVRSVNGSDLYLSLDSEPWLKADAPQNDETRLLHHLLSSVMHGATGPDIYVSYLPSEQNKARQEESELARNWKQAGPFPTPISDLIQELADEPTLLVSVRLNDGTWLNFLASYVERIEFWPVRSVGLLAFAILVIVALSIWAIRRLTAPFGEFAVAATRLGTDVNAAPIAEHGHAEVRAAIRAFNEMQSKLRRFIQDRTEMLAAVSHDLRTPITRLRLRAECLNDRVQSAKFLADLREMEDMIAGILTFAKDDVISEPTIRFDLIATLHSICDEFADSGFDVSFAGDGRLPYPCRRIAIRRCITNLIENAIKYGRQAELSIEATRTEIMIHVDDRGPGIPEQSREEVFRPFYRLEASRSRDSGGSGLGLTVARTVARAHGGDVILSGRPGGGGLRATIVLPQCEVSLFARSAQAAAGDLGQSPMVADFACSETERP